MNNNINIASKIIYFMLALCLFSACKAEIDNWDYPSSRISGQFLYKDQPVQILGTASDASTGYMLQLIQLGPGKWNSGFIQMNAKEDGSYTILTFDGDYGLKITPGRGPWVPITDTLKFTLSGEKTDVNFNVTPYFWMSNYSDSYTDSTFTATFNLEKVVPSAVLEKVVIFVGTTKILDNVSRVYEKSFTNLNPGMNTISVDLKTLSAADKRKLRQTGLLSARVGVKTRTVTDYIFATSAKQITN